MKNTVYEVMTPSNVIFAMYFALIWVFSNSFLCKKLSFHTVPPSGARINCKILQYTIFYCSYPEYQEKAHGTKDRRGNHALCSIAKTNICFPKLFLGYYCKKYTLHLDLTAALLFRLFIQSRAFSS